MNVSPIYNELNKSWKSTCRVLLGEEIGELKDYEEWLKGFRPKLGKRKSSVSGKEVTLATDDYCESANFVSLDEAKEKTIDSLSINEIKDIDTIIESLTEKWEYTGNKVLGNSKFVDTSDDIMDSHYVLESAHVQQSNNIFASFFVTTKSKYIFGSNWVVNGEFYIRSGGLGSKRTIGTIFQEDCSDMYFSYMCTGCHDLMFCINQKNKRNCIGNLELPKEKYLELKKKLVGEIRDELKESKRFPSIFDLASRGRPDTKIRVSVPFNKYEEDMGQIEKSFKSAFKIILKAEAEQVTDYEEWLSGHFPRIRELVSPFGSKVYDADWSTFMLYPEERTVSREEAEALSKLHIDESEAGSLDGIKAGLPKIGYFTGEFLFGKCMNVIKSPMVSNSSNIYAVADANYSNYSAVDFTLINSKYAFGSHRISESQFCIKCYNSLNLNRCFELDSCSNCADTLFAHNCEGLQDAMFCFNVKGKRYAIGNAMLPPEQYRKIKDSLVEQIAGEIVKKKRLKYDIFNIGCAKR